MHNRILGVIERPAARGKVGRLTRWSAICLPSEAREATALARRIKRALARTISAIADVLYRDAPTRTLR